MLIFISIKRYSYPPKPFEKKDADKKTKKQMDKKRENYEQNNLLEVDRVGIALEIVGPRLDKEPVLHCALTTQVYPANNSTNRDERFGDD